MIIQTIYPSSSLLSEFIYCYYIIENTKTNFENEHYSFPHTLNALSIYNNGTSLITDRHIIINGNNNSTPFTILQGKCTKPLLVSLNGSFSRITILFKPLGINQFIKIPLGHLMGVRSSLFNQWDGNEYQEMLDQLFNNGCIASQIYKLEEFLISIYKPLRIPQLVKSLEYLSNFEYEPSMEEIAYIVNIPLRTFNRLFKLHLGVSPIMHRQIARFRHSLENKIFKKQLKTLTEIGYISNFYDQSYFNKCYKQLSGSSPKKFFNIVEQVGDSKLVFQYLKK